MHPGTVAEFSYNVLRNIKNTEIISSAQFLDCIKQNLHYFFVYNGLVLGAHFGIGLDLVSGEFLMNMSKF